MRKFILSIIGAVGLFSTTGFAAEPTSELTPKEAVKLIALKSDVLANTVSAFALGDYEWLLSFESDNLIRIVDLMRELRATKARLHVREELPFYTGPRVTLGEFTSALRA